jgi:hypothetical protein
LKVDQCQPHENFQQGHHCFQVVNYVRNKPGALLKNFMRLALFHFQKYWLLRRGIVSDFPAPLKTRQPILPYCTDFTHLGQVVLFQVLHSLMCSKACSKSPISLQFLNDPPLSPAHKVYRSRLPLPEILILK